MELAMEISTLKSESPYFLNGTHIDIRLSVAHLVNLGSNPSRLQAAGYSISVLISIRSIGYYQPENSKTTPPTI